MKRGPFLVAGLIVLAIVVIIIVLAAVLTPQETNSAYAAAVQFMNAAGRGDETAAFALLDERMQTYVQDRCPSRQVTACIASYIPDEWGAFQSVVFRRAAPDRSQMRGDSVAAYDVELIATYAEGKGFSGVCIYQRMEQSEAGQWRVAGYAGFVSCGEPESRNMPSNPDAPNRAP